MTSQSAEPGGERSAASTPHDGERVTIVVPVYNRTGALLDEAVDSLLSQDYSDLEVVAIDDGSTDETPQVLAAYAERHPERFRWERQEENQGQAAALNRGFELAHGTLLGYLNSDDVLLPGAISRLASELAADPDAVLAYPCYRVIDESGGIYAEMAPPDYSRVESVRLQDTIVGPGALFRAAALKRAGPLRTDLRYLGDEELWLRLSRAGRFARVDETLACWRRHGGALTIAEQGREMAEERLRILDALFAEEDDPELLAVRDQAYRNAFVLAATVVAPGFNGAGERYYILDHHARQVSSRSGDRSSEARLASAQQQLVVQERRIEDLEREVHGLRKALLEGRPLSRLAYEGASQMLRPLARRIRRSESGAR
jgi:glycosyltransferase involved in cell wall biosynthesis